MTKFRRVYEAAILKTLGASSRLIATMLLLEYGVLGASPARSARSARSPELGESRASRSICRGRRRPAITLIGIVATAVFVAASACLPASDVLRHKPLATLRAE